MSPGVRTMPAEMVLPTATAMPKPTPRTCRSLPFSLRGCLGRRSGSARGSVGVGNVGSHGKSRVRAIIRSGRENASGAGKELAHLRRAMAAQAVHDFEEKLARGRIGKEAERRAVVGDPIGTGVEQGRVLDRGAQGENACAGGLAGTNPERRVLDDNAGLWVEFKSSGAFEVGLGVGLATPNVRGCDEVRYILPKVGRAKADLREWTRGGSDHDNLSRGNESK